ncbi:hypothetical protein Q3V94_12880 [Caloramator sp. CAR-1]|uniref:tyrosine-protein phosphatase n=1 Tax=Caloramator sp. CAR-1 TaxID=3062777 RepID=UPI0026E165FE|nr:CpsB/CapC family capsule biosynthesis tyrosine phosphatase [Caloramator sp. CAR-1]MDO6355950.1 hypothetical protein [Caloramator sp. CAR-1]
MLDIHSHIIPEIDDGADSFEIFFEMAKIAQEDGVETIVATPHFIAGRYETDYETVKKHVNDLNLYLKNQNIQINILAGQEILISKDLLSYLHQGLISPINDTNYMLVELPFDEIPKYTFDILYELKIKNITPIVAHPERYLEIIKQPEKINDFIDEGCLFQINSSSLLGYFGKDVKNTATLFLKHNIVDFIGSDCHDSIRRKPKVNEALNIIKNTKRDVYEKILLNSKSFLQNESITTSAEKIKPKKSFFSFFLRG